MIAVVLLLGFVPVCRGQEYEASYYAKLSWVPDEGFFISSTVDAGVDFGRLDLGGRLKINENEFSELYLDLVWYERPIRLSGRTTFTAASFSEGFLKIRYWEDPWKVECTGTVSAEEPFALEFSGTYEDEVEAEWSLVLKDSLAEAKVSLELPVGQGQIYLAAKIKEGAEPSLAAKWGGDTPWGKLTLEFDNLTFSAGKLPREWVEGEWEFEYDLSIDAKELAAELAAKATYYLNEESGYGISARLRQAVELGLKRLHLYLFGPGWEARLKCVAREFYLTAERAVGENLLFGTEAYVYEEEWEASLWLDGTVNDSIEWIVGMDLDDGAVAELYCELYYEY